MTFIPSDVGRLLDRKLGGFAITTHLENGSE